MRRHGQTLKRWRYVGLYDDRVMLCAARARIGPLGQCFWGFWDRESGTQLSNTRLRPGSREVTMDGSTVVIAAGELSARLELGESKAIEAICPSGSGWGWTAKRAGVPIAATIETADGSWAMDALGVDDQSAGYHRRRTGWHWSAGVGRAVDGRPVAWNLVEGINDPRTRSERAVWVDGEPHEPGPVEFGGLSTVGFGSGEGLSFTPGAERARDDNFLLVRSSYRHRFGEFGGSLDGIELARGYGVMEQHDALW